MPKKTKREKIIAEYRRKLQHVARAPEDTGGNQPLLAKTDRRKLLAITSPHQINTPVSVLPQKAAPVDTAEFSAIRHDLAKTLILAAISVATELAFYFTLKT